MSYSSYLNMYPNYYSSSYSSSRYPYYSSSQYSNNYHNYNNEYYTNNNSSSSNQYYGSSYQQTTPYFNYANKDYYGSLQQLNSSNYYSSNNKSTCNTCSNYYSSSSLTKVKPFMTNSCGDLSYNQSCSNSTKPNSYYNYSNGSSDQLNKISTAPTYNNTTSSYSSYSHSNSLNDLNSSSYPKNDSNYVTNFSNYENSVNNISNNNSYSQSQSYSNYEATLNNYYKSYNDTSSNLENSTTTINPNKNCSCSNSSLTNHDSINNKNNYSSSTSLAEYDNNYYESNHLHYNENNTSQVNLNKSTSNSVDQLNKTSSNYNEDCGDGYKCGEFVPISQANLTNYKTSETTSSNYVNNATTTNTTKLPTNIIESVEKIEINDSTKDSQRHPPLVIALPAANESINQNNTTDSIQEVNRKYESEPVNTKNDKKLTEFTVSHRHSSKHNKNNQKNLTSKSKISFEEEIHSPFKVISDKSIDSSISESIPSFTTLDDSVIKLSDNYSTFGSRTINTFGDYVPLDRSKKFSKFTEANKTNEDLSTTYESSSIPSFTNRKDKSDNYRNEFKGSFNNSNSYDFDSMVDQISKDVYSSFKIDRNLDFSTTENKIVNSNKSSKLIENNKNDRLDLLLDKLAVKLTDKTNKKKEKETINHAINQTSNYLSTTNNLNKNSSYINEFKTNSKYNPELDKFYANTQNQNYQYQPKVRLENNQSKSNLGYLGSKYKPEQVYQSNGKEDRSIITNHRSKEWKSYGLLGLDDDKSSSGYTNELFGTNDHSTGIPLKDLIDSSKSSLNFNYNNYNDQSLNNYSYVSHPVNDHNYSFLSSYANNYKVNSKNNNTRGSNVVTESFKNKSYTDNSKTIELMAKYFN